MKEARLSSFLYVPVLVLALLCAGASMSSPVSADTINLTYANFPPAPTFPCIQMERWVKEVEKRTDGKVTIKTFPGSTLLGAKNMFDGVVKGVADIGCLATAYQPGRFKLFQVMDLPMVFRKGAVASATMLELYKKYKPKSFADVKVITMFTCAPAQIMSKDAVRKLEDLDGMKLRAAGTGVKVMELLGAAPVGMPQSEVPEALQKGVVQGNVTSMDVLKDMKYAEYCPYVTIANLWVVPFAVVMNKSKWESLPDDVKKVMDDLAKEQAVWTGKYVDEHAAAAMEWSKKEHGVEFIELDAGQVKKWEAKVMGLRDAYVAEMKEAGIEGQAVLDDMLKFQTQYRKELD
jgi:TRAP-type C4-dicarboxylate transport system substrate-binding protein